MSKKKSKHCLRCQLWKDHNGPDTFSFLWGRILYDTIEAKQIVSDGRDPEEVDIAELKDSVAYPPPKPDPKSGSLKIPFAVGLRKFISITFLLMNQF